jgi:hypothetical protein
MQLEIVRRKALGTVNLVQLEDPEGRPVLPPDGTSLRSPCGVYRVRHKPEFGDWVELRVVEGKLPKDFLEVVSP